MYNYENALWATRHREHRGPGNWGPAADVENPLFPLQSFVCVGDGDSPVARGTLRYYLIRQCRFGVVGPETGMPSNKLVRVLSSLSLGPEAKANCGCGTAGMRHFEDDKMAEVRRREPANHPMRVLFAKRLVRSICKTFNAPGPPFGVAASLAA